MVKGLRGINNAICDVDHYPMRTALITSLLFSFALAARAATTVGDNFNDNSKDPTKWGTDTISVGRFSEQDGQLEFWVEPTISTPLTGASSRPWILNQLPYDLDWSVELEPEIACSCNSVGDALAGGLLLQSVGNPAYHLVLVNQDRKTGIFTGASETIATLFSGSVTNGSVTTARPLATMIRLEFNSTTKVIRALHAQITALPPTNLVFSVVGTFGVAGGGGANGNGAWGMTSGNKFAIAVIGIAEHQAGTALTESDFFSITINTPPNNAPTASNDVYATTQDTSLHIPASGVLANDFDPEGAALAAGIVTNPAHSVSFTLNPNGSFNYTPTLGFAGIDQFTYVANDGTNTSRPATVNLAVAATTSTGDLVNVQFDATPLGVDPVRLTFSNVGVGGSTSVTPIDPTQAGTVSGSFVLLSNLVFEVATTANITAPIDLCFSLTGPIASNVFAVIRILHNEGGMLVDRTTTSEFSTQTICAQVSSLSPFALALHPPPHDLAVTALTAPKKVTLKSGVAPKPSKISVTIQNLGPTSEVISNVDVLTQLVQVNIESLGACAAPVATLVVPKKFPITLKAKSKLSLSYSATLGCSNDDATGVGHEDYRYTVTIDRTVLDGLPDTNATNDACPRAPKGTDKNGCGGKGGADVLTDMVMKSHH